MSHFVITNGLLYSYGDNNYGQLGLGDKDIRHTLTQVINPNCRITSVSNYFGHTMIIDENGHLWSCGHNNLGQLGLNDYVNRLLLTQVSTTQTFQVVACGDYHTAAIDSEGFLWVCGDNSHGQLGLGFDVGRVKISLTKVSDKKFRTVCCSSVYTMVIDEDGFLWGCGDNRGGQLGLGSCKQVNVLTKISEQQFSTISSYQYTIAIDVDGYLWFCGKKYYDGAFFDSDVIVLSKVPNLEQKFLAVSCELMSTILIDDEERLWCAGTNENGNLGVGHDKTVPLCINDVFTQSVIYITLHFGFAYVIDKNGYLWISGNIPNRSVFTKISLDKPADILMNCPSRKIGLHTKGAIH